MNFVPVRLNTLRASVPLLFDVYVNYKDTYIKYKSSSEFFEESLIKKFQAKKIKKLFVPEEQEPQYLQYLDSALNQLTQKGIQVESRAAFAQDTMRAEAENIQKNLETEEGYRETSDRIWKVVNFIGNEPKALALMLGSAGISVDSTEHSSSVSTIALSLAVQVDIVDEDDLMAIAVAALVHDLGLTKLGFDSNTSYEKLEIKDKMLFQKHPLFAVEQVAGKRYISPRTLRIIEDHHEYGEGEGYPGKKRISKLPISSQVFNLSDAYDHFCIEKKLAQKEAIDAFVETRGSHYDMTHIEILEKLIKA